jgi:hypothetical protein
LASLSARIIVAFSMRPPPFFATTRRTPTLSESLRAIRAWWTGKRPSLRAQIREQNLVERLAAEIEEAERAGGGKPS